MHVNRWEASCKGTNAASLGACTPHLHHCTTSGALPLEWKDHGCRTGRCRLQPQPGECLVCWSLLPRGLHLQQGPAHQTLAPAWSCSIHLPVLLPVRPRIHLERMCIPKTHHCFIFWCRTSESSDRYNCRYFLHSFEMRGSSKGGEWLASGWMGWRVSEVGAERLGQLRLECA